MLIIAVVVAVTIGITKAKLDNIVSYTYYNAYSTLRKISTEMLADWDPSDEEYKQSTIGLDKRFVFNVTKDYRFFSTLVSHIPFGFRIPLNRVRAGNTATVYGCPSSAKYYSSIGNGASVSSENFIRYYTQGGECLGSILNDYKNNSESNIKCPGRYKGLATYAPRHAPGITEHEDYFCTYECSDLTFCSTFHTSPTGSCSCGLNMTDYFDVSCDGADESFNSTLHSSGNREYLGQGNINNATILSRTLMSGNVCKMQIECNDGYEFVSEGTKYGFPIGNCKKVEQKVTCWDGSQVDYESQCPFKFTCWDGSFVHHLNECPACTNKPAKIPCGQTWNEISCKLTGSVKTCSSGSILDESSCKCYVPCWDGSQVDYDWQCPSKVTCWDGSFVHYQSECPACTNKPAVIPCGQSWDEKTCKLTGSVKTCPSGYKLNTSTCKCIAEGGSSEDKCTKTCSSGYILNTSSCTCEKQPCSNKPSTIPCGQSWDEANCRLTGTAKTCGDGYILDSRCNCVCNRTCSSGYTLNTSSCTCEKNACSNKPSRIPCGQSWDETNCRLTGTVKTCPSGYELNESTCACSPLTTCWDGSQASSESDCPPSVTCWDGSKKGSYSDCPPCTNKPDTIPCGQSWDESTCSLTGSAKTCPSGQHLNSSCNCISTCPANPGCGKICNNETGIISDLPGFSKECSDETYEWSEEQCKCIPSPRTLPRKGENFCKLFERHANIMSGSEVCSGSVISNGTTNFADKSPDITLRNGLRVYNMHTDARAISDLANNTQGGSYDGVPNTNSYGYTVYVDIDGSRGDSQLWSDVYPFYITLSGKIIPAYDTSNPEQSGGDSVRHMQVSVENENYNSGRRSIKWLAKSVPFKEGACIAGYVGDSTPYCKNGTSYTQAVECTSNINSFCRVKQIQPVKFFF